MAESNSTRKTIGNGLRKAGDYVDATEQLLRLNPFIDAGARAKESVDGWLDDVWNQEWNWDSEGAPFAWSARPHGGTKADKSTMKAVAFRTPIYWLLLGASKIKPASMLRNAGDFVYGEDD